jgi:hypothetical protein
VEEKRLSFCEAIFLEPSALFVPVILFRGSEKIKAETFLGKR